MKEISVGELMENLQSLAEIKAQRDLKGSWYKDIHTYLDSLLDEIKEVKDELKLDRQCFLEDELADLLWNISCILEHLDIEGRVDKENVFKRAHFKYEKRVKNRAGVDSWESVKEQQKIELEIENKQKTNHKSIAKLVK